MYYKIPMKKHLYIILGFSLLISLSFFSSCKKRGCTDPESLTYNPEAQKDDGTCQYQGQVVIWYGLHTSQHLWANGATKLWIFVDGYSVATTPVTNYWTDSVPCGDPGSITVTVDLGNQKLRYVPLMVMDQTGWKCFIDDMPVTANSCLIWELMWN